MFIAITSLIHVLIMWYYMYDAGQLIACAIYKTQLLEGNTYETNAYEVN